MMAQDETKNVPVTLENGTSILIEARIKAKEIDVASSNLLEARFDELLAPIEGVATTLKAVVGRAKPQKATVEMGFDVAVEAGRLTALIAKGEAKANFKLTLEWTFKAKE